MHDRIVVQRHRGDDARLNARCLAVCAVELALDSLAHVGVSEGRLAIHIGPLQARRGFASGHVDRLLHLGQHIGEVHARLGVVSKHVGERRLPRYIEIAKDVAEMDDARRYKINGRILEVLVEVVVVAVANDGVRNRLGVGNLVIGLPANLGQRVVAATLMRQGWGELQDTLSDGVAEAGGVVPIFTLEVIDKDALSPLA